MSLSLSGKPKLEGASLVTINATMDVAVCREVLENICEACELLNVETERAKTWKGMIQKLPDYEINEDGAIKEWLYPAFPDNYHHRHQSHIYPVFPGISVTEETDKGIYDACKVAVEKRLVIGLASQSGWSMAHMANIYARLGDGNRALECLEILLRSSTGPNLFTYHNDWRNMGLSLGGWGAVPPFQIDANFGITAAVLEMLVFSRPGMIKFLPAVPDSWEKGAAAGLRCRGQVTVDIDWDFKVKMMAARAVSAKTQTVVVKFPRVPRDVKSDDETASVSPSELGDGYLKVLLTEGRPVTLKAEFFD